MSLAAEHDALTDLQDAHNATPYKCDRSGACCQVGLQLPLMECEHIARNLKATYRDDPAGLATVVERLVHAFDDPHYNWKEGIGSQMCAFFEDGCSIYPFRPAVCRMYGVTLEVDEFCPRKRLPSGDSFVFAQKETDRQMARYYRILDNYGRLHPKKDFTVFMPAGVLSFLLPPARLKALRARTQRKFWSRWRGYRTQYQPSYRRPERRRSNVVFPFAERWLKKGT